MSKKVIFHTLLTHRQKPHVRSKSAVSKWSLVSVKIQLQTSDDRYYVCTSDTSLQITLAVRQFDVTRNRFGHWLLSSWWENEKVNDRKH